MKEAKKLKAFINVSWILLFVIWIICISTGQYLHIIIEDNKFTEICYFIDNHLWLKYIVTCVMYYFNWIIVIYAILKKRILSYQPIIISGIILGFWILKLVFEQYAIANYIDILTFLSLLFIDYKKWKRIIFGLLATLLFTVLSFYIKNIFIIGIDFVNLPTILVFIFSIDTYIMALIYYLYTRKESNDGRLVNFLQIRQKVENCYNHIRNTFSNRNRSNSNFIDNLAFNYCAIIFFIITYGSILIVAIMFHRIIEVSISVLCFHIFRHYDEKTFHASTDFRCWCVSMISFTMVMKLSLPLYQSILFQILLAYVLTKVMYYVKDYLDLVKERNCEKRALSLIELSLDDLMKVLLPKKFSENDIKAVYAYIHKDRNVLIDSLLIKYSMSKSTLYRLIKKANKILNNDIEK